MHNFPHPPHALQVDGTLSKREHSAHRMAGCGLTDPAAGFQIREFPRSHGKFGDVTAPKDYMNGMEGFATILLVIAMALTLLVLFIGIGAFAVGGKFNQKYSNKLMRMRVLMQGVAIILFAVVMVLSGG